MKRGGPLRRKTPLNRGTKPLKRTGRLPPISKAERKRRRENKPLHDEYRRERPNCECGCGRQATSIHEIFGGSVRHRARGSRCCILHLAEIPGHRRIQHWEKADQLALKLESDPEGFDLGECLKVWGRAPTAILIDEVLHRMAKNLPTASELESDLRDVNRHIELLRRQLADKEARQNYLRVLLKKAQARERAIAAARLTER